MTDPTRLLNRKEASAHLKNVHGIIRAASTLAKLACMGGGPPFRKAGRNPLYPISELDAWALQLLSPLMTSTSTKAEEMRDDG